jgi:hypothetical protein
VRREPTPRMLLPALVMLFAIAIPGAANAQWQAGCQGGAMFSNSGKGGTAALPAAGVPLTTVTGLSSRRVTSWFFGDGAALLNQVSSGRGSATITPLDAVLNSLAVEREDARTFGCHISHKIAARVTAEFSVDYSGAQLTTSDAALAAIEAGRASFVSAFSAPLPAGQGGMTPLAAAAATTTVDNVRGHQVFTTAVLHINLRAAGKLIPYATLGGGIVSNRGGAPTATLTGNYRFTSPPGAPNAGTLAHDETDTVTMHYSIGRNAFVGVVGGGMKYDVTQRWGLRLDIRAHVSRNSVSTLLDTRASVPALPSGAIRVLGTNPALQFSASPTASPSLSGAPLADFQTFRAGAIQGQIQIVPGLFWRF